MGEEEVGTPEDGELTGEDAAGAGAEMSVIGMGGAVPEIELAIAIAAMVLELQQLVLLRSVFS